MQFLLVTFALLASTTAQLTQLEQLQLLSAGGVGSLGLSGFSGLSSDDLSGQLTATNLRSLRSGLNGGLVAFNGLRAGPGLAQFSRGLPLNGLPLNALSLSSLNARLVPATRPRRPSIGELVTRTTGQVHDPDPTGERVAAAIRQTAGQLVARELQNSARINIQTERAVRAARLVSERSMLSNPLSHFGHDLLDLPLDSVRPQSNLLAELEAELALTRPREVPRLFGLAALEAELQLERLTSALRVQRPLVSSSNGLAQLRAELALRQVSGVATRPMRIIRVVKPTGLSGSSLQTRLDLQRIAALTARPSLVASLESELTLRRPLSALQSNRQLKAAAQLQLEDLQRKK